MLTAATPTAQVLLAERPPAPVGKPQGEQKSSVATPVVWRPLRGGTEGDGKPQEYSTADLLEVRRRLLRAAL